MSLNASFDLQSSHPNDLVNRFAFQFRERNGVLDWDAVQRANIDEIIRTRNTFTLNVHIPPQ